MIGGREEKRRKDKRMKEQGKTGVNTTAKKKIQSKKARTTVRQK